MNKSYLKHLDNWSEEVKNAAFKNRFSYIFEKASLFLKFGKEKYRKLDFFNEPNELLSDEQIELVIQGCKQVLDGRGFISEKPFENLGVTGFYALMRLFHFEPISRKSKIIQLKDSNGVLDEITFKHIIEATEVTYFNYCSYNLNKF